MLSAYWCCVYFLAYRYLHRFSISNHPAAPARRWPPPRADEILAGQLADVQRSARRQHGHGRRQARTRARPAAVGAAAPALVPGRTTAARSGDHQAAPARLRPSTCSSRHRGRPVAGRRRNRRRQHSHGRRRGPRPGPPAIAAAALAIATGRTPTARSADHQAAPARRWPPPRAAVS